MRTFSNKIALFISGPDMELKQDMAFLRSIKTEVGMMLRQAAKDGLKKNNDLCLSEAQIAEVCAWRQEFEKVQKDEAFCDAYLQAAPLFKVHLQQIDKDRDKPMLTALSTEGGHIESILLNIRMERARRDMVRPMKYGEDASKRAQEVVTHVLQECYAVDPEKVEGVLAISAWSKVDPASPAASAVAKEALERASTVYLQALDREEYAILAYIAKVVADRETANIQQAEARERRKKANPGLRGQGFIARIIGEALHGGGNKVPRRGAAKNGLRDLVSQAEAFSQKQAS